MPVDEHGNRAELIMDANSTISRMNISRLYEHYLNAASRDVAKHLCSQLGVKKGEKKCYGALLNLFDENKTKFNQLYSYLMGYYEIVSPKMFKAFNELPAQGMFDHLYSVIKNELYLYLPTDSEVEYVEVIKKLEKHYRPLYGPVTYVGNSGKTITTKSKVRISSVYIMELEKIGDAWSAVSSGKLQHFGILSQLTKQDKFSNPTRNQAVKAVGETEGRILASYAGRRVVAEIMDRNNNPKTHKAIVTGILNANDPTNIENLVDRNDIPYGGAKPIQLVNHIAQCSGWGYAFWSKKNTYPVKPVSSTTA